MALSHQLAARPAANIEGLIQVGELGLGLLLSAGLIFVRRDSVHGLNTAASV